MKTYISLILLFIVTSAAAQNNRAYAPVAPAFDDYVWNCAMGDDSDYTNVTLGTDFFGDKTKTYRNEHGQVLLTIKRSKNIFNDLITSVTNRNGQTLLQLQKTKDIFGAEIVNITGPDQQLIGSFKRSTDIFGNKVTEIKDIAHNKTTTITVGKDFFNQKQIKIEGPRNSYENMVANFMEELQY